MRCSSELYQSNALAAHVTNHCLQKERSENYGLYEEGNERWHEELAELVNARGRELAQVGHVFPNPVTGRAEPRTFHNWVLPQLKNIVVQSLLAVRQRVDECRPDQYGTSTVCFQLFGFDFICDDSLKVTLLEVNGCPGVAEKLNQVIVDDLLSLVILPKFPLEGVHHPQEGNTIEGRGGSTPSSSTNEFECIFDGKKAV